MARHLSHEGHHVELCLGEGTTIAPPKGVSLRILTHDIIREITPGDGVVVSGYLPGKVLMDLVSSGKPFHVDFYCLTAPEILRQSTLQGLRLLRERRRRLLRYRLLVECAETVYLSNACQLAFLGGLFYPDWKPGTTQLVDSLGEKCREMPMGVRDDAFPSNTPNPYPEIILGRPVFLWGGGIWSWFDTSTLIRAFKVLSDHQHPAALFFIGGRRLSGREEHERPIREAIALSESLGILDRSVFFNEQAGAKACDIPSFVDHCTAGVMANPASFEAACSWRTRYLDLLWGARPLVASGHDPLADRMQESGAAEIVPTGAVEELSSAIVRMSDDPGRQVAMGLSSGQLGLKLRWSSVLRPLLDAARNPGSFRWSLRKDPRLWAIRYKIGL
jgi:hypothetical protein